ncbi:acyltransferase [Pedobacter sp. ASV28]|uniref:acyltransferase n=1 Tax=Pedobacter sp. ASV28 TaxID=2795123 RepID=UPI0018EDB358|nr:acyltransferase [Pedobacter sp. ASV28]
MSGPNNFIHPTAVVDEGCMLGSHIKIWHFSHLMEQTSIGDHCNIGQNVFIANGVKLGENVKVQNNVSLYNGLFCEDDVFIGPSVVFTNVINPRSAINRKNEYKPTILQKGASIGANSTIICGLTIGKYAMIGAGSVVTKSVKPYALVYGNPAKQYGWVGEFGNKLIFDKNQMAYCQETDQQYKLENNIVVRIK